ncbi:ABC transporter ATP-binding protein [Bosea sp. SSUT16]|jgi:lipopolysaccharide transport system ATP-binding protein|uniref:ABC transporter ATP-binding protein n=1 Tax=Bosea spartocytisi TaxID=2773451 RepID=A0A927E6A1_9HYPH|nr:ABC transporter ATP-binding protein [Bosea spartocytisi]MBD3845153.1 ABC transporter ATP-binding protein [Bosea spartocytisi]MCT4472322.1 ABC transporter ATP-binding protein [Bosea spartocytisi]
MSRVVLSVERLGKAFTSYRSNLLRFASWFGAPTHPDKEYWAARDISFELRTGEALALIGQNGAGKSTLLKLITGTLRPTEGIVAVNGRISAILELGLGFNPEFTGRENVFQAGGLMGFSQHEIAAFLPDLEDFAELGDFFDQPLRVYSSGMQARLAFSLATAMRPEILIVDEVLSVGDSYFQHKSFDRIRQFKDQGTAILFVSHSMGDVRALCDRVLLLDKGRALKDGPPDEVADYYNAMIAEKENAKLTVEQKRVQSGWVSTRSGTFEVKAAALELLDAQSREPVAVARVGQKLLLRLRAKAESDIPTLVLGYMIRDRTGHVVWGTNTWHTKQTVSGVTAGETIEFELRFTCRLGPGSYSFSPALVSSDTHLENNYEWSDNAIIFDVINVDEHFFIGTCFLDGSFDIKRLQA